jgi:hypothetical protein
MGVETLIAIGTAVGVKGTAAAGFTGAAIVGSAGYGAYKGVEAVAGSGKEEKGGSAPNTSAIEARAKEAEATATAQAKEATRKRLAQQTQTIFAGGLGLDSESQGKRSTLGVG